jgi:cyclohexyl-isocyanide hydratase
VSAISPDEVLTIGGLIFEDMDQADITGPFEVLSRIPNSSFHLIAKKKEPVRDIMGFLLTPSLTLAQSPQVDVLVVPGGTGVNVMMEDEEVLEFVRRKAATSKIVLSVCTGALICGRPVSFKEGARRATGRLTTCSPFSEHSRWTHAWFMTAPLVSAAGVTAGIDAALRLAAILRGDDVAQSIQLYMQYAPEPPFNSGSPRSAPPHVVALTRAHLREVLAAQGRVVERRRQAKSGIRLPKIPKLSEAAPLAQWR